MLRATRVVRKAAVKADRLADTVTLDHAGRSGGRAALKTHGGIEFLLDLDRPATLGDGDAVALEDGRLVEVKAAPQRLLEVRAENPLRLLNLAYHLGSRHAPVEVTADALYVEDDAALAELVRGQGCRAAPVTRPFQPLRGVAAHDCGHDHGHGHRHDQHHHGHGDTGHHHQHGDDHGHSHHHHHDEGHGTEDRHGPHGHDAHGASSRKGGHEPSPEHKHGR